MFHIFKKFSVGPLVLQATGFPGTGICGLAVDMNVPL